jgi:hypothetical protein
VTACRRAWKKKPANKTKYQKSFAEDVGGNTSYTSVDEGRKKEGNERTKAYRVIGKEKVGHMRKLFIIFL